MKLVHQAKELPSGGGFVPTMGALHEGHATLLRESVANSEFTVLSIFVNPTQFGPNEDLAKYPRTLEADLEVARKTGVDYVYAPSVEEIYPSGYSTYIEVEGVSAPLCGAYRPGHFRGVATVVHRLFQLVRPKRAYFGQKDLQQCLVIQRMVKDLTVPIELVTVPTVREPDGLAMSSRNRYLSPEDRAKAIVIFRALESVRDAHAAGERNVPELLAQAETVFRAVPEFRVQYAEIRSFPDLHAIERVDGRAAFLIAGYFGSTRLIDNVILA